MKDQREKYNKSAKTFRRYKKAVDRNSVISFDIFDTLIHRTVSRPEDIFTLAAETIYPSHEEADAFRERRIAAEHEARMEKGEVTLQDIYHHLEARKFPVRQLMQAEIMCELENCFPDRVMTRLYDYARQSGKTVLIISDMYLSPDVIRNMLNKCGIDLRNADLYVSCDAGVSKRSGQLFRYVLDKRHLNRKDFVHFGDSLKSDILGGIRAGIHVCLVSRPGRISEKLPFRLS